MTPSRSMSPDAAEKFMVSMKTPATAMSPVNVSAQVPALWNVFPPLEVLVNRQARLKLSPSQE